ncbi:MAG: class I SAM-dependent methyltransferase, partial [Phycisphaerae bacterium]|nr:class I SAM-dependent methyltransferase [Phycisphaerae bacterium]
ISHARQKNVAQANRSSRDFERIFADFFAGHDFTGERIVDLGPGQWDFGRMVAERGGRCEGVDNDPAVLELGTYLGMTVHDANLRTFDPTPFAGQLDGLFCKFAVNAFWHKNDADRAAFTASLDRMLTPQGWGWVAPWNGRPKEGVDDDAARRILAAQRDAFAAVGWTAYELTETQAQDYGMGGRVENHPLFIRGLELADGPRLSRAM